MATIAASEEVLESKQDRRPALLLVAGCLLFIGGLIAIGDLESLRFADHSHFADKVFCESEPIDVVFTGVSRMARAVDAYAIAAALGDRGRDMRLYDLSRPGPSYRVQRQMLKELLARRKIGLIIAEYTTREPLLPPRWAGVVTSGDFVHDLMQQSRIIDIGRAIHDRFAGLDSALSDPWEGCGPRRKPANIYDTTFGRPIDPRTLKMAKARLAKRGFREHTLFFDRADNQYQLRLVAENIADARAHGTPIVFVNLPAFDERPLTAAERAEFKQRFGVELYTWDEATWEQLRDGGFADGNHLAVPGARMVTPWFADIIRANGL